MMHLRLMALMTAVAAMAPAAVFNFYSGFNTAGDTEGWTIKTYGYALPGGSLPAQVPTGGYSGGYLQTKDQMDGFLFFIAPGTWSGDLYGGTLSFYLRNQNPNNYRDNGYMGDPVVWIQGSGGPDLFAVGLPGATSQWTYNSIVLDASFPWALNTSGSNPASSAQILATLSSVTQIGILADWVARWDGHPAGCAYPTGNCEDITGLDEVRLVSAEIPEPGTLGLLGAGLAALWAWRRRAA